MYKTTFLAPDFRSQIVQDWPTVGLIILNTDLTCERDFSMLKTASNLNFNQYVNRIAFTNPMTKHNLETLLDDISSVTADILPACALDVVVFCCTSASALLGDAAIHQAIQQSKPGSKVITTASASVLNMQRQGHKKISLLSPYSEMVSLGLADYFESNGLEIVSLTYMNMEDDRDVARLSAEAITVAARAAIDPSADALFISCTAMRVVEIKQYLEKHLNIPVFSSNHSTFWETMRTITALR